MADTHHHHHHHHHHRRRRHPADCCDRAHTHTPEPPAHATCAHRGSPSAAAPAPMPCGAGDGSASGAPRSAALPRPPSDLERAVRAIQKGRLTAPEKAARIHALFAAQRARAAATAELGLRGARGSFPGCGAARGCAHYARNCWIKAACCGRYYPCRRCHDAAEAHAIDRRATALVACALCGDADQPVAACCRTCGVRFARYFCEPCRLYDDSPRTRAYHCADCGICRVGRGLGVDFEHCKKCNTCIPIGDVRDHPCRERNLDSNCPICGDYLATTTEQSIFLACGHPIHENCLKRHMQTSFVCPVCSKSIPEKRHMDAWYRKLDRRLVLDKMPKEVRNRVSRVLCNDCETKTVARFHFQFHRCKDCKGYNTRVLEQYDVDPKDLPPQLVVEPSMEDDMPDAGAAQASEANTGQDGQDVVQGGSSPGAAAGAGASAAGNSPAKAHT